MTEPRDFRFAGQGMFQYGAEEPTSLELTCRDDDGATVTVIIGQDQLIALAKLLRQFEVDFPGAFRGH